MIGLMFCREEDQLRLAKMGVIASMQPYHCADDGRWAERKIGKERARTTYAFRSLKDGGAVLAFDRAAGQSLDVAKVRLLIGRNEADRGAVAPPDGAL